MAVAAMSVATTAAAALLLCFAVGGVHAHQKCRADIHTQWPCLLFSSILLLCLFKMRILKNSER